MVPYRAILRYYRCGTPYRVTPHTARYFFREASGSPQWCETLSWCLVSDKAHLCNVGDQDRGDHKSPKITGGVKILNFGGSLNLTPVGGQNRDDLAV